MLYRLNEEALGTGEVRDKNLDRIMAELRQVPIFHLFHNLSAYARELPFQNSNSSMGSGFLPSRFLDIRFKSKYARQGTESFFYFHLDMFKEINF